MQEINKKPMVDVLSEQTAKTVVMREDKYVYLDTKEEVAQTLVVQAELKVEEDYQKDLILQEIKDKKTYLEKTDFKFLQGYNPKESESLVEIEALRDEAREFIRANE